MIHTLKFSFTRCYLIPCHKGYLQIDTALPGQYTAYRRKLRRLDIDVNGNTLAAADPSPCRSHWFCRGALKRQWCGPDRASSGKNLPRERDKSQTKSIQSIPPLEFSIHCLPVPHTASSQFFHPSAHRANCIFLKNDTLLIPPDFRFCGPHYPHARTHFRFNLADSCGWHGFLRRCTDEQSPIPVPGSTPSTFYC